MKARIMTDELGVLSCQTSSHKPVEFIFPISSLIEWYPLNLNYEYRHNPKLDRLYLVMTEKELDHYSYGITSTQGRVISEEGSFIQTEWRCTEVHEDNLSVMAEGTDLGLVTMEKEFTKEDINDNRRVIAELEGELRAELDERLKGKLDTPEQYKAYATMDWETKDIALFKMATEEELKNYLLYGKLHVMCELMRRVLA